MVPGAGIETPRTSTPLIVWVRVVLFHKGFRYSPFVCVCLIRHGWHTVGTRMAHGLAQPLPVSASSLLPMTSAAKPSAEGMNAAYTLSVVDGVEWPKRPATT